MAPSTDPTTPAPPPAPLPPPAPCDVVYDSRGHPYAPSVGSFVVLIGAWMIAHVLAIRRDKGVRPPWTAEGLNADPAYRLDIHMNTFEAWRAAARAKLQADSRWVAAMAYVDAVGADQHPPRTDHCIFCANAALPIGEIDPPSADASAQYDCFRPSALPLPPLCENHIASGTAMLFALCAPTMVWRLALAMCARTPHVELSTLLPVAAASSERLATTAREIADFSIERLDLPFMTVPLVWPAPPPAAPQ